MLLYFFRKKKEKKEEEKRKKEKKKEKTYNTTQYFFLQIFTFGCRPSKKRKKENLTARVHGRMHAATGACAPDYSDHDTRAG